MSYALGVGPLFNVSKYSNYRHALLVKVIYEYSTLCMKDAESDKDSVEIDPRLEEIVERILEKCMLDGKFQ